MARRRSSEWFDRSDLDGFLHRSWLKSSGVGDDTFRGRPVIGICNSWSELVNCNVHLRGLAEAVKRGVLQAGGFPREFPVMSLGESLMKPTTMLYRNLMAMDVEESIRSYPLDGVVLLTGCDKTNPASILGACSANIPTIVVTGGPMLNGRWRGRELGSCSDCWHYHEELRGGPHQRAGLHRDRGLDVALERALHDDGDRVDDGLRDRGARADAAGRRGHPGGRLPPRAPRRDGGTADRRARRARPAPLGHPHARGARERHPRAARDLGLDERDHPPDRLRGAARHRAAALALRRAVREHAVARRPQARRRPPDGGLLLRRRAAGGPRADPRPAPPRRRHRHRPDGRREPRRRADRDHRRRP